MARKPNYAFERNSRAKAKAEKREAKRQAKLAARANAQSAAPEPRDAGGADDAAGERLAGQALDDRTDGA